MEMRKWRMQRPQPQPQPQLLSQLHHQFIGLPLPLLWIQKKNRSESSVNPNVSQVSIHIDKNTGFTFWIPLFFAGTGQHDPLSDAEDLREAIFTWITPANATSP